MKKQMENKWLGMRKEIDEAIRAGLTAQEFMELNDISRDQWYRMKPKGFKWNQIQSVLNIKRKINHKPPVMIEPLKPLETPEIKPETLNENEKVAIVICKGSDLKNLLTTLLD